MREASFGRCEIKEIPIKQRNGGIRKWRQRLRWGLGLGKRPFCWRF